jgi:hypothetical protein
MRRRKQDPDRDQVGRVAHIEGHAAAGEDVGRASTGIACLLEAGQASKDSPVNGTSSTVFRPMSDS